MEDEIGVKKAAQVTGSADISIIDFAFLPAEITVQTGTQLQWLNNGSATHQVRGGSPPITYQLTITGTATCDDWSAIAMADPTDATISYDPSQSGTWDSQTSITVTAQAEWPNSIVRQASVVLQRPDCPSDYFVYLPLIMLSTQTEESIYLPIIAGDTASAESSSQIGPIEVTPTQIPFSSANSSTPIQDSNDKADSYTLSVSNHVEVAQAGELQSPTAQEWGSSQLLPGESFTYLFTMPGTYDYYDPLHPQMTGRVIVKENQPPVVTIAAPAEDTVVGGTMIQVNGTVNDDGQIIQVLVNDLPATLTGNQFATTLTLDAGAQMINVVAEDDGGLTGLASRIVYVDAEGPLMEVHAPKDRQSIYSLRPLITVVYDDFLSDVNPATLQVVLSNNKGAAVSVTGDLTVNEKQAIGAPNFDLSQGTIYTLTASIKDAVGNLSTVRSTFYVPEDVAGITPPAQPPIAGWVSGVVYDSATCGGEREYQPLDCKGVAGALVTLAEVNETSLRHAQIARAQQLVESAGQNLPTQPTVTDVSTPLSGTVVTGPDGFFAFPVATTARYWLRIEKNGYTYSQRSADIVRERSTPINEIYLTPLDSALTVCDTAGCNHTSADGQMKVEIPLGAIPAGEVLDVTATEFDQVEFLPSGELPAGTWETYAFNLGGDSDYTFQKSITVSIKNSKGFTPGSEIPLGYWNQSLMQWEHEGIAVVDPTGEWVVMQVLHFSNHDPNYPQTTDPTPTIPPTTLPEPTVCPGASEPGCSIALASGILREEYSLPSVQVLDQQFAPGFHYDSNQAEPRKLIAIGFALPASLGVEVGSYIQAELFIEGKKTANFTFAARDLLAGKSSANFRYMWDGRDAQGNRLPPGVYRYAVHLRIPYRAQYFATLNGRFGGPPDYNRPTGRFTTATLDKWIYDSVLLNSNADSPFGAGWLLNGQQRLTNDEAGHIMIAEGSQLNEYYFPGKDLLDNRVSNSNIADVLQQVVLTAPANVKTDLSIDPTIAAVPQSFSLSTQPVPFTIVATVVDAQPAQTGDMIVQDENTDDKRFFLPLITASQMEQSTAPSVTAQDEATAPILQPPDASLLTPQVNVGGIITQSTIWTLAKSPYTLTTNVTVAAGVTLTVEPGVIVKGSSNTALLVLGHLEAVGTASQPITFTSVADSAPFQWTGLVFNGGTGNLREVTVRYGGRGSSGWSNISVSNVLTGEVRIESSRVLSESYSNDRDCGLRILNSRVTVSDTLFSGNGTTQSWDYPLCISGANSSATLTSNRFVDNVNNRVYLANGAMMATNPTLVPQAIYDGYELESGFTIPAGLTLTVALGTLIKISNAFGGLNVLGHLQAVGTATQPITFTSVADSAPFQWTGLVFSSGTGYLREVTVRYGGRNTFDWSNISVSNVLTGEVRIESSRIISESYSNDRDCGLRIVNSRVTVSDTLFSGNGQQEWDYPLCIAGMNSKVVLNGNRFVENINNRVYISNGAMMSTNPMLVPQVLSDGYELESGFTVPTGVTLTVSPGTLVKVGSTFGGLKVLGHLEAVGTASQPITFTSVADSAPFQWTGLVFNGGTGNLREVTVRYGGRNTFDWSNISVSNVLTGEVHIESSRIISESYSNDRDCGLRIVNSRVTVSDTLFSGSGTTQSWDYPLCISGTNSTVILINNRFVGNINDRVYLTNGAMLATNPTLVPQAIYDGYELESGFTIPAGLTLTVAPGTLMKMSNVFGGLKVLGHLQAIGTTTQPITFTSVADNAPFQWTGLVFNGGTGHLREVTVRYGGRNTIAESNIFVSNVLTGEVRIESSRILSGYSSNVIDCGLRIVNSRVTVSDTLFSGNGNATNDYALCVNDTTSAINLVDSIFQSNLARPLTIPTAAIRSMRNNIFSNNGYNYALLTGDATLFAPMALGAQSGLVGYEIQGNITVPVGSLLALDPGVGLYWSSGKGLIVNGTLLALGTANQPITFTSRTNTAAGQWNGITLQNGSASLNYATVRYARTGLAATNSQLSLRGSAVNANQLDGIRLSGSEPQFSTVVSSISNNGSAAYGLLNETGKLVDARFTWWGHPSGPYHPLLNPTGQGNRVSDNVLFEPWLEEAVGSLGIENRTETDHTKLTYNPSDKSYTRYYPDGTVLHFNANGTHDYTLEPTGHKTIYTYNPDGTLATLQIILKGESSARWTWSFHYTNQRLTSILDPAGHTTTVAINAHGQLSKVEFPDATSYQFAYDAHSRMTQEIDKHGGVSINTYDAYGRIQTHIAAAQPVYDPESGQTSVTRSIKTFTPSASSYALVNDSTVGDPTNPAPSLPTNEELVDRVSYGRGERSGHTDRWGNWLDETDGEGRTTRYQRDDNGNLTRMVEPDGDCVEYSYDDRGNVLSEERMGAAQCASPKASRDPAQIQHKSYSYEARFNQIKRETDALGNTTVYVYDYEEVKGDAGKLIRIEYPPVDNGSGTIITPTVRYSYNGLGLLESETDARGVVKKYSYSQGTPDEADGIFAAGVTPVPGLLTQVTNDFAGFNQTTNYRAYDAAGNPGEVVGPSCCGSSQITHYSYDVWGRVLTSTDALGIVTRYEYDARGNLIRQTLDYTADGSTGRNVVTEYRYDANNRRLAESTQADGLRVQTRSSYDINGQLTSQEDGLGQRTTYFYDKADQLVKTVDPAGQTTVYSYTVDGRIEGVKDADGYSTHFTYDGFGQQISSLQDEAGLRLTISNTYDLNGNLLSVTDPVGVQSCYEYDSHNRRTAEIQDCGVGKLNLRNQSVYDLNGNLVRTIDPRGVVTQVEYDALNRRTKLIRDANGLQLTTRYQYDLTGNLVESSDERGVVTQYSYDALNRMTQSCQDALGLNLCTSYGYDRLNNQSRVTDPKGVTTQTIYNAFGRPVQQIQDAGGLNATTTFGYDNALNQVRISDANHHSTWYQYTPRDELEVERYADGTEIRYSYDGRGNLRLRTNQDNTTITSSYDGAGRLTQRDFSTGGWQKFAYDAASRMIAAEQTMNGHSSLLTFGYNALNDVTNTTQTLDGASWAVGYGYEYMAGKRTLTYPSGVQRIEGYDPLNRLDQVQQGDGSLIANYDYHDLESYFTLAYANGITNRTDYDTLYRTTRISSAVADYRYGYDAASNRTSMQRAHKTNQPADVYQYDTLYQVTQVWYGANAITPTAITSFDHKQFYQLDLVYNRLAVENDDVSQSYLPNDGEKLTNPMNRYETVDGKVFTYDLRGNTLNDGRNSYAYDLLNRQIGVQNSNGLSEYIYDALGRRIAKSVGGVMTHYVYDNRYRILEDRNGDGSLAARYTYGAGIDEPLTMERGSNTYFYHRDAQGSVSEMTNTTGGLVERYEYDIYGKVRVFDGAGGAVSVSGIGNSYLYTGRQYDKDSYNYYYRFRIYSYEIGRFLQTDPLGSVAGTGSYKYVENNPIDKVDSYGLQLEEVNVPSVNKIGKIGDPHSPPTGMYPTGKWYNFTRSATAECEALCSSLGGVESLFQTGRRSSVPILQGPKRIERGEPEEETRLREFKGVQQSYIVLVLTEYEVYDLYLVDAEELKCVCCKWSWLYYYYLWRPVSVRSFGEKRILTHKWEQESLIGTSVDLSKLLEEIGPTLGSDKD